MKSLTGGALLDAIDKDCNNMMFPIAWTMEEGENQLSRTWFLENLFREMNIDDELGWSFISYQQKVYYYFSI